jgi:hypothetical protein
VRQLEILRRIARAAKAANVTCMVVERTNHTGLIVGDVRTVVSRGAGLTEQYAEMVYRQLEDVLGRGWWR